MVDEFSVGGMTFQTYDPNKDPSGGIGHALAESRFDELFQLILDSEEAFQRGSSRFDYVAFGNALGSSSGVHLGIFQDRDMKENMLRAGGYTHVTGEGGKRIPLGEASDARIGHVWLGQYRQLNKVKR